MAVFESSKEVRTWYGLSTDSKPLKVLGIGHRFKEIDTGARYLWSGEQWVEDLTLIYAFLEALKLQGR
jgi:hypothetical protein